jgi:hypothetical protein
MKKILKGTVTIFMVCLMFSANDLLANAGSTIKEEKVENQIKMLQDQNEYNQAGIFPFLNETSVFPMEFSKSHVLFLGFILSVILFVFAHKNSFETDIYAFYHTNRDGSIIFENSEAESAYEFSTYLAKTFRILGILTSFATIILLFI